MLKKENRKNLIILSVITLLLLITVGSVFSVAAAAVKTQDTNQVETNTEVFYGEIELSNGDILVGRNENGCLTIDTLKAVDVFVNDNGNSQKVKIAKGTVKDALEKANITVNENQAVTPTLDTNIANDMVITIEDGAKVEITADGKTETVVAPIDTVEKALNDLGYNLSKDDVLNVDKNQQIKAGMKITLQRVTYKTETTRETIDFETETKITDELDEGETQVETEGKDGSKEITTQIKYVDGKKTDSKVVDEKTIKEPVNKVVLVGEEESAQTVAPFATNSSGANTFTDSSGNTVAYSQVLTGSGTAYTAPAGAGTATGVKAYLGGVAVNPNIIPYGSKLYVVSTDGSFVYGYCTAVDTGGALMDGSAIVDVFYPTYDQCVNFGRRDVNVYVLS